MKLSIVRFSHLLSAFLCLLAPQVNAQFVQQGTKLVGTGAGGNGQQGYSVALSTDGTTAAVGGYADNGIKGAIWIYTRTGAVWTQQGNKLVASDMTGGAGLGTSVSISGDGNTVLAGGANNGLNSGAAWVFTRSGGVWTQQGNKLVGDASGSAQQGKSVSISTDGNTALIGGPADASPGSAWVWTRANGVWTQQAKLIGTGNAGSSTLFGTSVALSGDGNTAIVGGPSDGSLTGAVWIFTRSGSTWTQQGNKLVGTGNVSLARHGYSVALSSDGNTAIEGAYYDNGLVGAAWVFTRSGGVWTQQGNKLVGTGGSANPYQGWSVALSGNGNTAMVGGYADTNAGAAWVFNRSGTTWTQQSKLVGTGSVSSTSGQGWSVALSSDGSTAMVGDNGNNNTAGAVWAYARNITPVLPHAFATQHVNLENGKNLRFNIHQKEHVVIRLFNSQGRMISQLLDETRAAGSYNLPLSKEAQGAYYLDLRAGNYHSTMNIRH